MRIGCLLSAALHKQHARRLFFPFCAAPRRPRRARRRTRASALASRGARVGGSRRRSRQRSRCGASLLLSPVVVLVSRLVFGRRFVRNGPSPACIATGDARAMRAARVRRGWFSPPQSSRDVARVVLSSFLLSFRRSAARGASSIHPHAGGGARICGRLFRPKTKRRR